MILTVTPNPAVDQTVWVPHLVAGEVNRPRESQLDPAGKGVNVSRMAHRLGWPTLAFGFTAGEIGHLIERALDDERVARHFVRVSGQTRIDTTVVDESNGKATSLYGPGPMVSRDALASLEETLYFWLQGGRVLVLAGSLPPGVPTDFYARAVERARRAGVRTVLDADGESLRRGIEARPDAIKPNVAEAQRLLGRKLESEEQVVEGARELASGGIQTVIISRGQKGAVCVSGEHAWRVIPPDVERRSTVGSGDSLVAGVAVSMARGDAIEDGLRLGTAAGAATAMTPGTMLGSALEVAALLPRVTIEPI
jgi:1-phosphofructokinase family hexose kinase